MLISVLTPAYNEAQYIGAAIDSVQKYNGRHEIEHIIIDDKSTDGTFEVASSWPCRFSGSVRVFRNPEKGKVNAINFAFEQSRGDLLVPFGGDDLLCAENIDARAAPLLTEIGPAISQAALLTFFETPERIGKRTPLRGGGNKSGGAVMMNRAFAEHYFPVPISLPNEDTWLNAISLGLECSVHKVDAIALLFRVHSGNSWNRNATFDEYSHSLALRNEAYRIAVEDYKPKVRFDIDRVKQLWQAEQLRRDGRILDLLGHASLPMSERRHFIFSAHPMLYEIKKRVGALRLPRWAHRSPS